jgi:hypothetical protein
MNNTKYTLFPNQVTRLMAAFLSGVMTSEQRASIRALLGAADAATDLTTPNSTASTYALRYAATPTQSKEFIAAFLRGDMTSRQQRDFCAYIDTTYAGAISTDRPASLYGRERALFPIQIKNVIARFLAGRVTDADQVVLRTLCCFDAATTAPEASYVAALRAAGATVTAPQQAAISTFISGEIAAGRWSKHKRLYFPIWQLAAANAICMKSLTSGTFSGSVIHGSGGVGVTSGGAGNMNTNTNLGALGITKTNFHFAMLLPNGPEENYSIPFSVNDYTTSSIFPFWNDGYSYTRVMERQFLADIFSYTGSVVSMGNDSVAGNLYLKEKVDTNTASDIIAGSVATAFPAANLFILGESTGATGMNNPIGAFSTSTELSSTQDAAYTSALTTLWEACVGRALSPI